MLKPLTLQISCNKMLVCTEQAGVSVFQIQPPIPKALLRWDRVSCFDFFSPTQYFTRYMSHADVPQMKRLEIAKQAVQTNKSAARTPPL